jgi:hypothetical protein
MATRPVGLIKGAGWSGPDKVEKLLKDDVQTLAMWREATVGTQGAHTDNVSMNDGHGNSKGYTVSRLKRDARSWGLLSNEQPVTPVTLRSPEIKARRDNPR